MLNPAEVEKTVGVAHCALAVATPKCKIRFADASARRLLREFLGRPERPGLLPRKLCRWLAQIDKSGAQKSLVIRRASQCLFVRQMRPHPADAIPLLLEVRTQTSEPSRNHAGITLRENDVLRWIAASKSDREIAQILHISSSTVGKHIEHLYSKLGVENRTAAASLYPTRGDEEDTTATASIAA